MHTLGARNKNEDLRALGTCAHDGERKVELRLAERLIASADEGVDRGVDSCLRDSCLCQHGCCLAATVLAPFLLAKDHRAHFVGGH